jgi:arginyl-tRNA synthetase
LYELSTLFHVYWSKGNENEKYKFLKEGNLINENIKIIITLLLIILKNGMKILNVSLPNKM